jgi:hypothetical protein
MEKPIIPLVEAFKMMQVNEEESPIENGEATHEEVCFVLQNITCTPLQNNRFSLFIYCIQ